MTDEQWQILLAIIKGENLKPLPVGFIIDSPWLPNWAGISIFDYFSNPELWFLANIKAIKTFPEVLFSLVFGQSMECVQSLLPLAPDVFGAKTNSPLPKKFYKVSVIYIIFLSLMYIKILLPFIIKRPIQFRKHIEEEGRRIRFAVSRGPLNIASFLMGSTDFLIALKT